jgi:hypothetical protein
MWLVGLAIILLFFLILLGSLREGLTSPQLYEIQKIMNNVNISSDEKIKLLYGDDASITILDAPILAILKDTNTDNEEKINALHDYFDGLVNERNNNPNSIYKNIPDKISSDDFFLINNIINNPDFENDTEKVFQMNSLKIKEPTFAPLIDINNKTIADDVKLYGDGEYAGPTISSLINETLYKTYISNTPAPSKSESKPDVVKAVTNEIKKLIPNEVKDISKDISKNVSKTIAKNNPFGKKKK